MDEGRRKCVRGVAAKDAEYFNAAARLMQGLGLFPNG